MWANWPGVQCFTQPQSLTSSDIDLESQTLSQLSDIRSNTFLQINKNSELDFVIFVSKEPFEISFFNWRK